MATLIINLDALCDAVDEARIKAAGTPWAARVDDAYAWLLEQETVTTDDRGRLWVPSRSSEGEGYWVNGCCGCEAGQFGRPCTHRAAKQLVARMLEKQGEAAKALSDRIARARLAVLELYS